MRRRRNYSRLLLYWFVAAAATGLAAQPPQLTVHVLEVKGDWQVQGSSARLTAGSGLTPGLRVIAATKRQGDAITLVQDADLSRQRTVCDGSDSDPCRNPVLVQGPTEAAAASGLTGMRGVLQAAFAVLLGNPPAIASHYALTLTRGPPLQKELEAVAAIEPGGIVVLPPAARDMFPGDYTIEIEPAGTKSALTVPAKLAAGGIWQPIPLASPGLYDLSMRDAEGHRLIEMLLLAVPPKRYDQAQQKLKQIEDQTASWSGPGAVADRHLIARAYLLSESQAP